MGHQGVQRPVFHQPFGSGFGPHLGHAGHIVNGVAHQRLKIHHQGRGHAKLGGHTGHIPLFAIHGVDDGDVGRDQLGQVFVAAGHHHLQARLLGALGQGADHIIGLHPRHVQHAPAQQAHHFVDGFDLGPQVIGHGGALGFVGRVNLVPKSGSLGIKHADRICRCHLFFEALQHIDHAAYGARGRAGGVTRDGPQIGHGMKSTVQITGTVYQ